MNNSPTTQRAAHRYGAAATLAERRSTELRGVRSDGELTRLRRELWEDPTGLTGGLSVTAERWVRAGLGDEELRLLQGESDDSVEERIRPPRWLGLVDDAVRSAPADSRNPYLDDLSSAVHLLAPAWFLIRHFEALLREAIAGIRESRSDAGVSEGLFAGVSEPPYEDLLSMMSRAVVLEFNLWLQDRSTEPTADDYGLFLKRFHSTEHSLEFLEIYQPLERAIVETLEQWMQLRIEFVQRLLDDLPAIRTTLGVEHTVSAVEWGTGDAHNGGRRVVIVVCDDGGRFTYKPRRLSIDRQFTALCSLLEGHAGLSIRTPLVLDRGEYGWTEFITQAPVRDLEDAAAFYRNHGSLLALLHVLGANDMHYENVVAAGTDPLLIDFETVIQPQPKLEAPSSHDLESFSRQMSDVWSQSVLAVGLLPSEIMRVEDGDVQRIDFSAMGNSGPQESFFAMPRLEGVGDGGVRIVRAKNTIPGSNNGAMTTDGASLSAYDFVDEIEAGFLNAYEAIRSIESARLATVFSGARVRVVLRPTMVYARILTESWHPDLLQNGLDRSFYWEVLQSSKILDYLPQDQQDAVAAREVSYLADRDVPMFTCDADSRDLLDASGALVVADFFARSAVEAVTARLDDASEDALRRQRWLIRASFSGREPSAAAAGDDLAARTPSPLGDASGTEDALYLDAASAAADRLRDLSVHDGTTSAPAWMTLNLIEETYWSIGPSGFDLFGGSPGIAIFLAEAGLALNRPELTEMALRIREDISTRFATSWAASSAEEDWRNYSVGAFGDFGAALMLDHCLERTTGEAFTPFSGVIDLAVQKIRSDDNYDIIAGAAGAVLAASLRADARPDASLLAVIDEGVARLRHGFGRSGFAAWTSALEGGAPLAGFSHGQSGIVYALSRAARHSVPAAVLLAECAPHAWAYEDTFYGPEASNWQDLREPEERQPAYMSAWCHGAPGLLLARTRSESLVGLPRTAATADALGRLAAPTALHQALSRPDNDSLCHGRMGNLLAFASVPGLDVTSEHVGGIVGDAARYLLDDVPRSGAPVSINVPTGMVGIAGIGLELLRWGQPAPVTDLLSFRTTARDELLDDDTAGRRHENA